MDAVTQLAQKWRGDAEKLRSYGDGRGADVVELLAGELERALQAGQGEVVDLTQAAEVSGYSKRRLRELVEAGDLENVGRKGAPRFRRGDLPRKPGKAPVGPYDVQEDARAIAGRIGGGS